MTPKVPVSRPIAWWMVIPQTLVLLTLVGFCAYLFWSQLGVLSVSLGAAIYLFYSYGSRYFLGRYHRQGYKLVRQQKYSEAIHFFERSYSFFSKHQWIDKYRYLTLLTPSETSYREMALLNIAFCYSQSGNGPETKAAYERTLTEFPSSAMARTALNLINAVEKSDI